MGIVIQNEAKISTFFARSAVFSMIVKWLTTYPAMCIYVCLCVFVYTHICIHIHRYRYLERDRHKTDRQTGYYSFAYAGFEPDLLLPVAACLSLPSSLGNRPGLLNLTQSIHISLPLLRV